MGTKYWKAKDSALDVFDGKVKEVIADLSNFYYGEKTEVIVDGKHYMKPVYDNKEEGLYIRVNGIRLCYDDFDIPVGNEITSSIKSGISPEQNKFNWAYNGWFGHFQMNLDRVPQYLKGIKWCDANKGTSEYEQLCKEYNCYPVGDREKASFYNALKQVGAITSSKKPIKSDYSDEEYWYPETKKVYRLYKYNSNGDYYTWDYDTLEEAQRMKPRGNRYTSYNIKEVEVPVQSSRKPIKSDFNPYYEKHPDTFVAYLVGDKDSITQEDIDKAEKEWYKLMYAGYGSLYGETGHLFLGPYENVKSYVEDYLGVGLLDDYLYTYDKDDSVLDHFETQPDKPLPTEKDYQDFVNQLNKYVAENYETHGNYGPIYKFDMYKGEGTNSDGYGHEYPNFIIYDDEGNLDMHSDDDITEYIRNELKVKGWYPEAVHSSSDFTIAVM